MLTQMKNDSYGDGRGQNPKRFGAEPAKTYYEEMPETGDSFGLSHSHGKLNRSSPIAKKNRISSARGSSEWKL